MILGRANPPWNQPWRRLNKKYCALPLELEDRQPSVAQEVCIAWAMEHPYCESVWQDAGCNGRFKLCQKGFIRDPKVGTDKPTSPEDIGCVITKGIIMKSKSTFY